VLESRASRRWCLGLSVLLLAGACERKAPNSHDRGAAPGASLSATLPQTRPDTSAAAASSAAATAALRDTSDLHADPRTVCASARTPVPAEDQPSSDERAQLVRCDSEALYYGIGVPRNFVKARHCALTEWPGDGAPIFGGATILMMLYANGQGVPQNLDLALRLACDVGGADAELASRLTHISDIRNGKLPAKLDFCDNVTSGLMGSACAAHGERIAAVQRAERKAKASAGLPGPELHALERKAAAFFDARARNEVDLTGTLRAALMIEERARLEDGFVAALEQLRTPAFPPPTSDGKNAERALRAVFTRVTTCKGMAERARLIPGSVTAEGVRKTQLLWIPYRAVWGVLAAKVQPELPRESVEEWLTAERAQQLQELSVACD
jgi:hypothetical protein